MPMTGGSAYQEDTEKRRGPNAPDYADAPDYATYDSSGLNRAEANQQRNVRGMQAVQAAPAAQAQGGQIGYGVPGMLQSAVKGEAPSVAQLQLQAGGEQIQRGIGAQMVTGRQGAGLQQGLGQNAMSQNMAALNQQQGQLRAGEQSTAMGQLANVATVQAQMQQQLNLSNAEMQNVQAQVNAQLAAQTQALQQQLINESLSRGLSIEDARVSAQNEVANQMRTLEFNTWSAMMTDLTSRQIADAGNTSIWQDMGLTSRPDIVSGGEHKGFFGKIADMLPDYDEAPYRDNPDSKEGGIEEYSSVTSDSEQAPYAAGPGGDVSPIQEPWQRLEEAMREKRREGAGSGFGRAEIGNLSPVDNALGFLGGDPQLKNKLVDYLTDESRLGMPSAQARTSIEGSSNLDLGQMGHLTEEEIARAKDRYFGGEPSPEDFPGAADPSLAAIPEQSLPQEFIAQLMHDYQTSQEADIRERQHTADRIKILEANEAQEATEAYRRNHEEQARLFNVWEEELRSLNDLKFDQEVSHNMRKYAPSEQFHREYLEEQRRMGVLQDLVKNDQDWDWISERLGIDPEKGMTDEQRSMAVFPNLYEDEYSGGFGGSSESEQAPYAESDKAMQEHLQKRRSKKDWGGKTGWSDWSEGFTRAMNEKSLIPGPQQKKAAESASRMTRNKIEHMLNPHTPRSESDAFFKGESWLQDPYKEPTLPQRKAYDKATGGTLEDLIRARENRAAHQDLVLQEMLYEQGKRPPPGDSYKDVMRDRYIATEDPRLAERIHDSEMAQLKMGPMVPGMTHSRSKSAYDQAQAAKMAEGEFVPGFMSEAGRDLRAGISDWKNQALRNAPFDRAETRDEVIRDRMGELRAIDAVESETSRVGPFQYEVKTPAVGGAAPPVKEAPVKNPFGEPDEGELLLKGKADKLNAAGEVAGLAQAASGGKEGIASYGLARGGTAAGSALGGAIGGPVGAKVGGVVGGMAGGALSSKFSNKKRIDPLSLKARQIKLG